MVGPSLGVGGPTQATDLTLADEVKRIAEAHLIAAAPDMYAALDAIIDGRMWSMSDNKFGAAKAALAKARGQA